MEDQSEYLYDSEEIELLGQLIMPDFELKSDVLEEMEIEASQSDEELAEAIHAIEETESHESPETTALSADDVHVSVPAMEIQQEVTSRFAKLDDDALEKIICETESTSTKRQTKYGVKIFKQWLTETKQDSNFEQFSTEQLDHILRNFYAEVRNTDDGDLEKLRLSGVLSTKNPKALLRKVWFDILLGFGRRGRENQRTFTDKTFAINQDDRGFKYIEMVVSETTKNHRGGLGDDNFEKSPRVYATYKQGCPVESFEFYMDKRNPKSDCFFQLPRIKILDSDNTWYTSRPYGIRMLNDMMKSISKDAGLSKVYTNHCVRATTINVLAHSGVSDREIMKITGHKCERSLNSYHSDSSDKQKRDYSAILQGDSSDTPNAIVPAVSSGSISSPLSSVQQNFAIANETRMPLTQINNTSHNVMQQINNLPRAPMYQKQFEVNNSTVHVYNYHMTHPGNQ
ncbi:KCTD1_15 [Mytilus edulis]|uniref:KCTD1_15 n=1 Tax=Mytilus edulis TaxID=6550 RepID=A0A8S3RPE5_MYTED|nr:KCTD1_15 [Mytilus edulis]